MQIYINILAALSTAVCVYWFVKEIRADRIETKARILKAAEERKKERKYQFARDYIKFRKEIHGE